MGVTPMVGTACPWGAMRRREQQESPVCVMAAMAREWAQGRTWGLQQPGACSSCPSSPGDLGKSLTALRGLPSPTLRGPGTGEGAELP